MNSATAEFVGNTYNVAYFTHEIQSVNEELQTGVGGLGVVACDHVMAAEEYGFPLIAIALFPTHGYYKQALMGDGMAVTYIPNNHAHIAQSTGEFFSLHISGEEVKVEIILLKDSVRNHTAVLMLNTDVEGNSDRMRGITRTMYGGKHATGVEDERWIKVAQAYVLGVGGMQALDHLGIDVDLYHLNESHAAFAQIYYLDELVREDASWDRAVEMVRSRFVFTNHTVVGAGNASHDLDMICDDIAEHYQSLSKETFTKLDIVRDHMVHMTPTCLALSGVVNGVSKLHGEILRSEWGDSGIIGILNGIHVPRWQMPEFRDVKNPQEIPEIKALYKEKLLRVCSEKTLEFGSTVNSNVDLGTLCSTPLVGFARRWAEYKRLTMPVHDKELPFVKKLLDMDLLSIVWGGKPHPDDHTMINHWNWLFRETEYNLKNTLVFLDYDLSGMLLLKAASDVWLNMMWYGYEASGTSGMSAMLNCSLNVSVADGMFFEPAMDGKFVPYGAHQHGDWESQYNADAHDLWRVMTRDVLPRFWHKESDIYSYVYDLKQMSEELFSSQRSFAEYADKMYRMPVT